MTRLFLIIVLLLSSVPAYAEWVPVGSIVVWKSDLFPMPPPLSPSLSESPSKEDTSESNAFEYAVDICVRQVQRELPFANFDAFIVNGIVKQFGTPQSFFKFEKCMAKYGHPLGDRIQ